MKNTIKNLVASHNGQKTIEEIVDSLSHYRHEDVKSTINWFLSDKIKLFSLIDNKLHFNFGKPYNIHTGQDFMGCVQNRLASKGYRWQEEIFNDGRADTLVYITRDPDCHWEPIHSATCLTVGWGRFYRAECWLKISDWLDEGGFEKSKVDKNINP